MKIKADWEERISFLVNLEESQFEGFDVYVLKLGPIDNRHSTD